MTLLIMAAGLGSRYGGLKQLDGIGPHGELIIEYSIYDAIKAGYQKVVLLIKEEHQQDFQEKIGQKIQDKIQLVYAFQTNDNVPSDYQVSGRKKPLGTGHAVLCCQEAVDGDDFVAINADDFYGFQAYQSIAQCLAHQPHHCMAGYALKNTLSEHGTVARGVCTLDDQGFLQDVVEHVKIDGTCLSHGQNPERLSPDTVVSMNAWGFHASAFSVFSQAFHAFLEEHKEDLDTCEFYIPHGVKRLLDQDRIQVLETSAKWYGVTYQEDKPQVKKAIAQLVQEGHYPERLWQV